MRLLRYVSIAAALAAAGCDTTVKPPPCTQTGCSSGKVCEEVAGRQPECFEPVYVSGRVYDLATAAGLADARVVGQDVDGAPVSSVAISGTDGSYEFSVAATRNPDGSPVSGSVTLRVDRAGYETFPSGLRTALPIALTAATHASGRWTVQGSLTDVGLQAIAGAPTGEITGTVALPNSGGALVVAECGGVAYTAACGTDGSYAIFNVPDGPCEVAGYTGGVSYTPVSVTVDSAGTNPVTADLAQSSVPTATVEGSISFVSKTEWGFTSVLLVVASTFDLARARGIAPPGLAARNVSPGPWSIAGVPDGHYRALAAFETDYLVRDPSDIGGTAVADFWVSGGSVYLSDPASLPAPSPETQPLQVFKITGAVRLMAPVADGTGVCTTLASLPADPGTLPVSGCTTTSTSPTFAWEAYPGTSYYAVSVVDENGSLVWGADVGTSTTATPDQALAVGSTYQVRVAAHHVTSSDTTLSTSEDLLGVFTIVQ